MLELLLAGLVAANVEIPSRWRHMLKILALVDVYLALRLVVSDLLREIGASHRTLEDEVIDHRRLYERQ